MPKYRVGISRMASEDAFAVVEAENEDEAGDIVLGMTSELDWDPGDYANDDAEVFHCEEVDDDEPSGAESGRYSECMAKALLFDRLFPAIQAAKAYDDALNAKEKAPDGDDYNAVLMPILQALADAATPATQEEPTDAEEPA